MPRSFEQSMSDLEQLIERLESGEIGLEEALKTYEKGMKLSQQCQKMLVDAEHRVQKLNEAPPHEATE